jgi:hypothetical protein
VRPDSSSRLAVVWRKVCELMPVSTQGKQVSNVGLRLAAIAQLPRLGWEHG